MGIIPIKQRAPLPKRARPMPAALPIIQARWPWPVVSPKGGATLIFPSRFSLGAGGAESTPPAQGQVYPAVVALPGASTSVGA